MRDREGAGRTQRGQREFEDTKRLGDTLGAIKWWGMWMRIGRLPSAPQCYGSAQWTTPILITVAECAVKVCLRTHNLHKLYARCGWNKLGCTWGEELPREGRHGRPPPTQFLLMLSVHVSVLTSLFPCDDVLYSKITPDCL